MQQRLYVGRDLMNCLLVNVVKPFRYITSLQSSLDPNPQTLDPPGSKCGSGASLVQFTDKAQEHGKKGKG